MLEPLHEFPATYRTLVGDTATIYAMEVDADMNLVYLGYVKYVGSFCGGHWDVNGYWKGNPQHIWNLKDPSDV